MGNHIFRALIITGGLLTATAGTAGAQMAVRQVRSDAFGYMVFGYGSVFGGQTYGGPALGGGYRAELDSLGIDLSFSILACTHTRGVPSTDCQTSDLNPIGMQLNVQGLYFLKSGVDSAVYVGGGLGWGQTGFSNYVVTSSTFWRGGGPQGKLSVGYELATRHRRERAFVQADAVLPFYRMTGETVIHSRTAPRGVPGTEHRYAPSLSVSVGFGFNAR
jgi:hypothetical protein